MPTARDGDDLSYPYDLHDEEFDPMALTQSLIAEQVAAVEDFIASDAAAKIGLDPKDETDDALLSRGL